MANLETEFSRMLENFFGEDLPMPTFGGTDGGWAPAIDVTDGEKAYTLRAELPGINPKEIQIDVHDNVVTLRGERREEKKEEKEHSVRREISYGSFTRQVALATDVDADAAEAKMDHGVLTLKLPKRASSPRKTIKVQ